MSILVIVRKDLKWKQGPVIAQACHAVSGLLWINAQDSRVLDYMSRLQDMTKIIYKIQNLKDLKELQQEFGKLGILSYEWIEQPENITTCIAVGPLEKNSQVNAILEKFNVKLY